MIKPLKILTLALFSLIFTTACTAQKQFIYIASPAKPQAIYVATLDTETGQFGPMTIAADDISTGFMALHPTKDVLYAATNTNGQKPSGSITAYSIDSKTGALTKTGNVPTNDNGNTHIEVSRDGKVVIQCHYQGDGTAAVLLNKDGALTKNVSNIKHTGSSINPRRQKEPHPHGVAIHQSGKYVCVADLGNDHVEVFAINNGKLSQASRWKAKPGAGPRHVSFHQNGKWLYSINELDNTMDALSFDASTGKLTQIQNINTLPKDFTGNSSTAEVVVHPNGKFLYGSNRGHESTVVFSIDQSNGKLTTIQHEPTQGKHPRFVGIDPTGQIYLAANTNTGNIVSFHINPSTGKLTPTGHQLKVARPMCIVFKQQ